MTGRPSVRIVDDDGLDVAFVTGRVARRVYRPLQRLMLQERANGARIDPEVADFIESLARLAAEHLALTATTTTAPPAPAAEPLSVGEPAAVVDVKTAAAALGVSPRRVRTLIADGRLPAVPGPAGHHRIDRAALDDLADARR